MSWSDGGLRGGAPRDPAGAWLPEAWDAARPAAVEFARGAFVPGIAAGPPLGHPPATLGIALGSSLGGSPHAAPHADGGFELPDFGAALAVRAGWGGGGTERAWAELVGDAADAREAQVRAELRAEFAAERAAQEAEHAAALEQAWAEGHAAGRVDGEADATAALAGTAAALDAAAVEMRAHEGRWLGELKAHVAALAVAVAHHVVGREVAADDALVTALVARAVAEFPPQESLAARVHPDDLGTLKAAWAEQPRAADLRWVPDARVARGGALVEGRERIVDGRVDTALERLYRALAGQTA